MGSMMYGWMAGTERLLLVREAAATPHMIEHPCPFYIRDTLPIGASSKGCGSMALRNWLRRLEKSAHGETYVISQKDGPPKIFPKSEYQAAWENAWRQMS